MSAKDVCTHCIFGGCVTDIYSGDTHFLSYTQSEPHSAMSVCSVMSGVLLSLLTQGLFGWAFTASPRPSATTARQGSAGEEQPLSVSGITTHIYTERQTHAERHACMHNNLHPLRKDQH